MHRIKFFVFILIILALFPGAALAQDTSPYPVDTLTVTGTGSASGSPDIANVGIGVEIVDQNLGTAFSQANDTMDAVISALQDAGIAQEDIRTIGLNVYSQRPPMETDQPTEYRVSNQINVTVRAIDNVEGIIDAAVNAGANNIFGLNFGLDDPAALEQTAREEAMADARQRATHLAELIGADLGEVIIVSEGTGGGVGPLGFESAALGRGGAGGAVVETGQLTVSVSLQVAFRINR